MTAVKRKKVYPQLIVIELILVGIAGAAAYYLLPKAGVPHSAALIFTGAAADRALTMVLRHRNKPLLPKFPVTIRTVPAARKTARKKAKP